MMPSTLHIFGIDFPLYYCGFLLAFPACTLFNALYYRKCYPVGNIKLVLLTMFGINMVYIFLLIFPYFTFGKYFHGFNWIRVIGFVPLLWGLLALISKTKVSVFLDFMVPTTGIANIFVHTGCIFGGCCYGFPITDYPQWLQWMGIYNNATQSYLFPIQLVENAIILVLIVFMVLWARSKRFKTGGRAFPLYMVLFCVTRFFCEYLRDNEKIVANLSEFSFWCILWTIEGVVWLIVLHKRANKPQEIPQEPDDLPIETAEAAA